MRRLLLVVLVALLASACGASEPVAVEPAAEQPQTQPASPVLDGRAALAAAEGEPHVLWFWGAH